MSILRRAAMVLLVTVVAGCASGAGTDVCDDVVSVSGYIVNLSLGLDNRAEDQYAQFRLDSLDALDVVATVAAGGTDAGADEVEAARRLEEGLARFIDEMDNVTWDVTRAVQRTSALEAWRGLATEEQLDRANLVESWVIESCGLPPAVDPGSDAPDVLPAPSIPSPTATDPPTGPVNEKSEAESLGATVASLFGLSIDANQTRCLGEELVGIVDQSSATSGSAEYLGQFQVAFDKCEIRFSVPEG